MIAAGLQRPVTAGRYHKQGIQIVEEVVFGSLESEGLEIVCRSGRYFVRYDVGAHNVAWREDEITELEVASIGSGGAAEHEAMLCLQKRLEKTGVNPYQQNWAPTKPRL